MQEADISIFLVFAPIAYLCSTIYHTNNKSVLEMMSMGMHFFGEPFILIYLVNALRSFDLTRDVN